MASPDEERINQATANIFAARAQLDDGLDDIVDLITQIKQQNTAGQVNPVTVDALIAAVQVERHRIEILHNVMPEPAPEPES